MNFPAYSFCKNRLREIVTCPEVTYLPPEPPLSFLRHPPPRLLPLCCCRCLFVLVSSGTQAK